jgi:hydroxymethylpyrimidine pyrophosphatase-like HAD family hydrolase
LLDRNGAVHDADRRAIAELIRRGVAVTIVTGRHYAGTRDIARSLELAGPICCVDGSAIVGVEGDRDLLSRPIAHEAHPALRDAIAGSSPAAFVLNRHEILYDATGAPWLPYLRGWSPRASRVDDLTAPEHWDANTEITALIAVGTEAAIQTASRRIGRAAGDLVDAVAFPIRREEFPGLWTLVARAAGATKGSALEWIAAYHGVDMGEVVAVGDWLNDVSMFRVAGRSFVMAHAPDEVKAVASDHLRADVTTGGGIAEAAARAGLL